MEDDRLAYEQLLQGIKFYVDKCIEDSNSDKTVVGIIKNIDVINGSYEVSINGQIYYGVNSIGGSCSINETVPILLPQGSYSNMTILKGGDGGGSGGSSSPVTSVNGKVGDVVITCNDIGAVDVNTSEKVDIDFSKYFE